MRSKASHSGRNEKLLSFSTIIASGPAMNDAGPENPTKPDSRGEAAVNSGAPTSAATLEKGRAAFDAHLAETTKPKRRRGRPIKHGKYATKNKIPVAQMDDGTGSLLLEENTSLEQPGLAAIGTEEIEDQFN